MTPRNAHRLQPRDSLYPPDVPPFSLPPSNDEPANEPQRVPLIDRGWFLLLLGSASIAILLACAWGWL